MCVFLFIKLNINYKIKAKQKKKYKKLICLSVYLSVSQSLCWITKQQTNVTLMSFFFNQYCSDFLFYFSHQEHSRTHWCSRITTSVVHHIKYKHVPLIFDNQKVYKKHFCLVKIIDLLFKMKAKCSKYVKTKQTLCGNFFFLNVNQFDIFINKVTGYLKSKSSYV